MTEKINEIKDFQVIYKDDNTMVMKMNGVVVVEDVASFQKMVQDAKMQIEFLQDEARIKVSVERLQNQIEEIEKYLAIENTEETK